MPATPGSSRPGGPWVDDLDAGERRRRGQVEPRGDDPVVRRRLERVRAVAVAQPARVHRRAARPAAVSSVTERAGVQRTTTSLVPHLDVVDHRAGAAVEAARAEGLEHDAAVSLGADPGPRVV